MAFQNIAFYHQCYPGGGAEVVSRNLARFFRNHGYRCILYCVDLATELLTSEDEELFDICPLPVLQHATQADNTAYLCQSLREKQADCLIVQVITNFPFSAVRQSTKCRIVFCMHSRPMWEVIQQKRRKCSEIPNPTWTRKIEFSLLRKPVYLLTDKLEKRYTKTYSTLLAHVDRMVMLCPQYRDYMKNLIRRAGYPEGIEKKFASIINPLAPAAAPTGIVEKEKIVLYVGRLVIDVKRVDRLLKVWQHIERLAPDWKLVLIGTGKDEEKLKKLAEQLGLRKAEFAGYHADVTPFFRKASFCCLTSDFEGLPMCFMEGQQYGVIPVSFDSYAGFREISCHGECGITVPAYDLRKYTSMLYEALSDPARQEQLRERSYEAAHRYELETVGRQWLELFESLQIEE